MKTSEARAVIETALADGRINLAEATRRQAAISRIASERRNVKTANWHWVSDILPEREIFA